MAKTKSRNNESFESLLRRFKRSCDDDGIVQETRARQEYQKPTQVKKLAKGRAIKRGKQKIEKECIHKKRLY